MTTVWFPKQILMDIHTHEESDISSKLTMVILCIWLNRNNWIWSQEKLTATHDYVNCLVVCRLVEN